MFLYLWALYKIMIMSVHRIQPHRCMYRYPQIALFAIPLVVLVGWGIGQVSMLLRLLLVF